MISNPDNENLDIFYLNTYIEYIYKIEEKSYFYFFMDKVRNWVAQFYKIHNISNEYLYYKIIKMLIYPKDTFEESILENKKK